MFRNDYSELCAEEVLDAIKAHMGEQNVGYGLDKYSERAKRRILQTFGLTGESDVFFLSGGTQTNMAVISYLLRPYEGVIAVDTGHINVHETGAVEGSGHKVITVPNVDGKLTADGVEEIVRTHTDEHKVKPSLVYISDTTETGSVYTLAELENLRAVCDKRGLKLFIDGARLGCALTSGGDVRAEDIGRIADVFYVGGTKNGALYGEAVVFRDGKEGKDFRYHIKNRGGMLAKGFVVGIMFDRLFEDGLYFTLAAHANKEARKLKEGFERLHLLLVGSSESNQLFVRLPKEKATVLSERYGAELWKEDGNEQVIRFVTSFATTDESVEELLRYLADNLY